jgi:hypothetical protein
MPYCGAIGAGVSVLAGSISGDPTVAALLMTYQSWLLHAAPSSARKLFGVGI